MNVVWLSLGLFFLFMILGVPIAMSIGLAAGASLLAMDTSLVVMAQKMFISTNSFTLIAIPFFMLVGAIMDRSGITEMLGKKNLTKGVKVEVGTQEAAIDLNIVVEYGSELHKVAEAVQENVKKAVETMTGLQVVEVNVNILGVNVKAEDGNSVQKLK